MLQDCLSGLNRGAGKDLNWSHRKNSTRLKQIYIAFLRPGVLLSFVREEEKELACCTSRVSRALEKKRACEENVYKAANVAGPGDTNSTREAQFMQQH